MSFIKERVQEKLNLLQEQKEQARLDEQRRKEAEEEERRQTYRKLEERRQAEEPQILVALDARFKSLQATGLPGLMEEFSGRKFSRIIPATQEEISENFKRLKDNPKSLLDIHQAMSRHGWHLGISVPQLESLDGDWSPKDLILNMYEHTYGPMLRNHDDIQETKLVTVTYAPESMLIIQGNRTTFRDLILEDTIRIETLTEALAEAIVDPRIVEAKQPRGGHPFAHNFPEVIGSMV
jgi:hypothetical protein